MPGMRRREFITLARWRSDGVAAGGAGAGACLRCRWLGSFAARAWRDWPRPAAGARVRRRFLYRDTLRTLGLDA